MRERGRYQIQCMKSRSSTGVGMKVDLNYNIETMRITDDGEDAANNHQSASSIMNQIKAKSSAPAGEDSTNKPFIKAQPKEGFSLETPQPRADVQGSKLKNMLAQIKAGT
jgi:hypothetical protein